jgi:hypothetical protein
MSDADTIYYCLFTLIFYCKRHLKASSHIILPLLLKIEANIECQTPFPPMRIREYMSSPTGIQKLPLAIGYSI